MNGLQGSLKQESSALCLRSQCVLSLEPFEEQLLSHEEVQPAAFHRVHLTLSLCHKQLVH